MSQELITIEAFPREVINKSYNKKIRKEGRIPAVLLEKGKATHLELTSKFLHRAWTGGKRFNMKLGDSTKVVKIQELQLNAVRREALHVDLMPE